MQRPPTSKPRGLCRYFKDPRGCYAGDKCKFLHADALPGPSDPPLLTPYDKNKRCKFYDQGYCKRGATCWFLHVDDDKAQDSEDDEPLCSICFEKPSTYGLLIQCSHIFCIDCIKQWRDPTGKPADTVSSGSIKSCPMCRTLSTSIVPSSRFYPHTSEGRARIVQQYKESTARVDCRYFQKSLAKYPDKPQCPFGSECMYRHCKPDGTVVQLLEKPVVAMRRYHASMDGNRNIASDFFWTQLEPETAEDVSAAIRRHVEELRRQAAGEADTDLLEALDAVVPGMEEATRRTEVAMRTMELISDALVGAGRQSLDMQSVMQQFQRIRDELVRNQEETRDAGTNLDEQLDERRRTSTGSRAVRYVRDLGGLADNMLISINGALNDESSDAGGPTVGVGVQNTGLPNPTDDMPALIPLSRPTNTNNAPRNPNTAVRSGRPVGTRVFVQAAIRVRSPTIIMRHLPPFVQGAAAAAAAAAPAPEEGPPNVSVELGLALASATTVISLAEDALRAERRAQDVHARIGVGTQRRTETQRLLAEARAVLPILRAELETSRTRLQELEAETPQQRFLVNERVDMLNDVMASMDARAAQQQPASQPPAGDDDDSDDDDMPGLRSVSSSSDEEDSDDDGGMPELRSVSSSSDEAEEDSDTDDSDIDERSTEMLMRALAAAVASESGAEEAAAMEILGALVGSPRGAATTPTPGVNSPRFSTVVDRTASGRTPPPPATSASTPVHSSAGTGSASTTSPWLAPATNTTHSAATATIERESPRIGLRGNNAAALAPVIPSASTSSLPLNSIAPSDAKSNATRRTSGDFTTDGRGRVISIGGGGSSREGLHWPVEVPDVAEDDRDSDSEDEDTNDDIETLSEATVPLPAVRKVSEFTTDGRGRVISVDSTSTSTNTAGTSTTTANAVASTSPPAEPSPSSGTGGLLGWFGSFF